jgi:hypothetical protein
MTANDRGARDVSSPAQLRGGCIESITTISCRTPWWEVTIGTDSSPDLILRVEDRGPQESKAIFRRDMRGLS